LPIGKKPCTFNGFSFWTLRTEWVVLQAREMAHSIVNVKDSVAFGKFKLLEATSYLPQTFNLPGAY